MDAFDADALIYAAVSGHPLGRRVRALFPAEIPSETGVVTGMGTAVGAGADRFVTNNQRDFSKTIDDIQITHPQDLPDPT